MRRWNGWGDDQVAVPASDALRDLIGAALGPGTPPRDVTFEEVCASVPPSRIAAHPLVDGDAATRVRHARGQGFPDLIAMRSGRGLVFPDGVARPAAAEDVAAVLDFARERALTVIPYGGGTSVVGHVNPPPAGAAPVLTVSLAGMSGLVEFDADSRLATFGAGVPGPALEAALGPLGFTLGHYPQSFELSTLGGWIATRSSGQQ